MLFASLSRRRLPQKKSIIQRRSINASSALSASPSLSSPQSIAMPPRSSKRKAPTATVAAATAASASAPSADPSWPSIAEAKQLVAELCASFYALGWVSGTGGGLSMRAGPQGQSVVMAPSGVQKERMTAEDMFVLRKADGEVVEEPKSNAARARQGLPPLKLSECAPLFMSAYELRDAGAVVHSHSLSAVAATLIQGESSSSFKATHLEMCKGIDGHGFHSTVEVPIVENTARECELTGRLREAIAAFPQSNAVLVRRHGVYVWGSTWQRAKAQAETYDYLFEAALRLKQAAGVDVSRPPPGWKEGGGDDDPAPPPAAAPAPTQAGGSSDAAGGGGNGGGGGGEPAAKKKARAAAADAAPDAAPAAAPPAPPASAPIKAIVLDIEGTVLPISYVKDTMFPYARERILPYLDEEFESEAVRAQLEALLGEKEERAGATTTGDGDELEERIFSLAQDFEEAGSHFVCAGERGGASGQSGGGGDADVGSGGVGGGRGARAHSEVARRNIIARAGLYLQALSDADVKSTALKAIQGSIWHEGFLKGDLRAPLFADVHSALERWTAQKGLKVFIYSSGSNKAQIDLFSHTESDGDLTKLISRHFDTTSGAKIDASSYEHIFGKLGLKNASPSQVLFVTDILAEAKAATEAGWKVVVAKRPGNKPLPARHGFKVVEHFEEEIF